MQVASTGRARAAPRWIGRGLVRRLLGATVVFGTLIGATRGTQDAIANGDTRTLTIVHAHTNESATVTFRRNGSYDSTALNQLNWLLRDWRLDEATKMDPRLFDIVWEVHRESGSREPVVVLSAYRAPQTNAMLRRRSRAVSEHSQHMAGRAMDLRLTDADMVRVRAIAMRLQHGGVGYYGPSGFIHLDSGSVRAWPRMTHDQLARLFPDGKTVHIPANGKPFARYEEARAEILSRGGAVAGYAVAGADDGTTGRRSLWASLFGSDDEDSEYYRATAGARARVGRNVTAYAAPGADDPGRIVTAYSQRSAAQPAPRTQVASVAPSAEPAATSAPSSGFRFFWQRDPEPTAAAAQIEEPQETAAMAPVPPRRPDELSVAASLVPMPPARPIELAFAAVPATPAPRPERAHRPG